MIYGAFDPFAWAADPNRRSDVFDADAPAAPLRDASGTVKGFAGALGGMIPLFQKISTSDFGRARSLLELEFQTPGDLSIPASEAYAVGARSWIMR